MALILTLWIATGILSVVVLALLGMQSPQDRQRFLNNYGFVALVVGFTWPLIGAAALTALPMAIIYVVMLVLGKIVPPLVDGFAAPVEEYLEARRARLEAPKSRIPY